MKENDVENVMDKNSVRPTSLRNNSPTRSGPEPPSTTDPRAVSNSSQNRSEKRASSAILLNIIFASSCVMGGPKDEVDESDAVECVREEDAEELGGDAGRL